MVTALGDTVGMPVGMTLGIMVIQAGTILGMVGTVVGVILGITATEDGMVLIIVDGMDIRAIGMVAVTFVTMAAIQEA